LFIHFANCRFEKDDILAFLDEVLKRYPYKNKTKINRIKSIINSGIFEKCCTPSDKYISEEIEPDYKASLIDSNKKTIIANIRMERVSKQKYIAKKMGNFKDWNNVDDKKLNVYTVIYDIGLDNFRLKEIFKTIVSNKKLKKILLTGISGVYIKYKKAISIGVYSQSAVASEYSSIRELIFDGLDNFLSTDERVKLKICEECGKFYIANRKWQRFCHIRGKKCHDDFNRKKNAKKKAKYMREERLKPDKANWIT
jgi:hypothetical protein